MSELLLAATEARDTFRRMLGRLVESGRIEDPNWIEAKRDLLQLTQRLTDAIENAKRNRGVGIGSGGDITGPVVTVLLRGEDPPAVEIPAGLGLTVEVRDEGRGYSDTFKRIDDDPRHGSGPMSQDGLAHA